MAFITGKHSQNKGQDTVFQLRELRQYSAQRGWLVVDEYVRLRAIEGSKDSRPELNRLMVDAKHGS